MEDGARQLYGAEARRVLEQEGLLEMVARALPAEGRPFFQAAKLTAGDGAAGDLFSQDKLVADDGAADGTLGSGLGRSVALEGDTALVGAPQSTVSGNSSQGAAYVFARSGSN